MAGQSTSIRISSLPGCVQGPNGRSLADDLAQIKLLGGGDPRGDELTEETFNHAWGRADAQSAFRRFRNFSQFKAFVDQYAESKRCTPECRRERAEPFKPEGDPDTCLAPPEPELPPPPNPRKPYAAKNTKTGANPQPDISGFSEDHPGWFDEEPARQAEAKAPAPQPNIVPSIGELAAGGVESGLAAFNEEPPDIGDGTKPVFNVKFDGKFFILDFHGCYVDAAMNCLADWPFFIASVRNRTKAKTVSRESNASGGVRVKVAAEKSDEIAVWGIDTNDGGISTYRLHLRINEAGEIVFVRYEIRKDEDSRTLKHISQLPRAQTIAAVDSDIPFLGPAIFGGVFSGALSLVSMFDPTFWNALEIFVDTQKARYDKGAPLTQEELMPELLRPPH